MTIARRLILLVAVPLLVLVGLGIFTRVQLAGIERQSRFVAETQIGSLAALGHIAQTSAELRLDVRNHLLSKDKAEQARIRAAFQAGKATLAQALRQVLANPDLGRQGPEFDGGISKLERSVDCRRGEGYGAGGCGTPG